MVAQLIQGHYYRIVLKGKYKDKLELSDYQINAVTRKSSLEMYGNFDIRSTFFDEDGILTYLTYVADDTDIYICNKLNSLDPCEVDAENIFIPVTIIDKNECEEFFFTQKYNFNVLGVERTFNRPAERFDWEQEIDITIRHALNECDMFAGDIITTDFLSDEYLKLKPKIITDKENHEALITARNVRNLAEEKRKEVERLWYNEEKKKLDDRDLELKVRKNQVDYEYNRIIDKTQQANNFLSKVEKLKTELMDIHAELKELATQLSTTIPSWQEVYNKIYGDN